jgi:hypothetical protein
MVRTSVVAASGAHRIGVVTEQWRMGVAILERVNVFLLLITNLT